MFFSSYDTSMVINELLVWTGFQYDQRTLAFLQVLLLMLKEFEFSALQIQVLLSPSTCTTMVQNNTYKEVNNINLEQYIYQVV